MASEDSSPYRKSGKKMKVGRKAKQEYAGKGQKVSIHQNSSMQLASFVRKLVDPETAKYFAEIANVIEGTEIELEERAVICGNALEGSRGKEVELATDYIISHTLQTLLEGRSYNHLCGFLQGCANNFSHIATDISGSHVAETFLKSLDLHLQEDNEMKQL